MPRVLTATFTSRASSSYDTEVLYAGYRYDTETGLFHVRNRVLHPVIGSWMQRDPLGYADGVNLHLYANARGLVLVDPSGSASMLAGCAIGGGLGVVGTLAYDWWADQLDPCRTSIKTVLNAVLGCIGGAAMVVFANPLKLLKEIALALDDLILAPPGAVTVGGSFLAWAASIPGLSGIVSGAGLTVAGITEILKNGVQDFADDMCCYFGV
jgi:RHS repeat-associated protein